MQYLVGRNPVMEALEMDMGVTNLYIQKGELKGFIKKIEKKLTIWELKSNTSIKNTSKNSQKTLLIKVLWQKCQVLVIQALMK